MECLIRLLIGRSQCSRKQAVVVPSIVLCRYRAFQLFHIIVRHRRLCPDCRRQILVAILCSRYDTSSQLAPSVPLIHCDSLIKSCLYSMIICTSTISKTDVSLRSIALVQTSGSTTLTYRLGLKHVIRGIKSSVPDYNFRHNFTAVVFHHE